MPDNFVYGEPVTSEIDHYFWSKRGITQIEAI